MKNNEKTEQQKEQAIIRATERWINEFNAIPTTVVAKLADNELDEIEELTQFDDEEDYREFLPMWGYMWTLATIQTKSGPKETWTLCKSADSEFTIVKSSE